VIRLGNITPLKDENTHIIIKIHKEKEPELKRANKNKRSTDVLTRVGYELFDVLRKLRLEIAREEGMPPYIIFSDKTLVDMSAKAPLDRPAMLNVSGVGEVKFDKYGKRFIDAIAEYLNANPDSVTSIIDNKDIMEDKGAEVAKNTSFERVTYNRKMNRPDGAGASWTEEEDKQLDEEYSSGMKIFEIARVHDRTNGAIRARLKKHGLIE